MSIGDSNLAIVFPDSERVIYRRNPLREVICQVRFPAILKIEAQVPAEFQDRVRHRFPDFSESQAVEGAMQIPAEVASQLPPGVAKQLGQLAGQFKVSAGAGERSYRFSSENGKWTINLDRESLSLTCSDYTRWEEFRSLLDPAIEALIDLYQPASYSRVGLRYRDAICRSELSLEGTPWSELLNSGIVGELGDEAVSDHITIAARQLGVRLGNDDQVLVRHGLGAGTSDEICYIVDADFYRTTRTEAADVGRVLDRFNREAGRLFRWTIRDRLHRAMEPEAVHP